jgi:hypothetical protein
VAFSTQLNGSKEPLLVLALHECYAFPELLAILGATHRGLVRKHNPSHQRQGILHFEVPEFVGLSLRQLAFLLQKSYRVMDL